MQDRALTRSRVVSTRLLLFLGGLSFRDLAREEGQSLAEYVMILALIAIVVSTALIFLRGTIEGLFSKMESAL